MVKVVTKSRILIQKPLSMTNPPSSGQITSGDNWGSTAFVSQSCQRPLFLQSQRFGCSGPRFCGHLKCKISAGHGCLVEGCLGLPDVFPEIYWIVIFLRRWRKRGQESELPDLAWKSQTFFSQTSGTTRKLFFKPMLWCLFSNTIRFATLLLLMNPPQADVKATNMRSPTGRRQRLRLKATNVAERKPAQPELGDWKRQFCTSFFCCQHPHCAMTLLGHSSASVRIEVGRHSLVPLPPIKRVGRGKCSWCFNPRESPQLSVNNVGLSAIGSTRCPHGEVGAE